MKTRLLLAATLVATLRVSGEDAEFPWQTDLESAWAQARDRGKPLLVVFRCER